MGQGFLVPSIHHFCVHRVPRRGGSSSLLLPEGAGQAETHGLPTSFWRNEPMARHDEQRIQDVQTVREEGLATGGPASLASCVSSLVSRMDSHVRGDDRHGSGGQILSIRSHRQAVRQRRQMSRGPGATESVVCPQGCIFHSRRGERTPCGITTNKAIRSPALRAGSSPLRSHAHEGAPVWEFWVLVLRASMGSGACDLECPA